MFPSDQELKRSCKRLVGPLVTAHFAECLQRTMRYAGIATCLLSKNLSCILEV